MDVQERANKTLAATSALPGFLAKWLNGVMEQQEIAVLGFGEQPTLGEIMVIEQYLPFKRVYMYDPQYRGPFGEAPKRLMTRNPTEIPSGTNAVVVHPGFSMDDWQAHDLWGTPNKWFETLEAFKPTLLAWCTYCDSELEADTAWLDQHGYTALNCPLNTKYFRENFAWDDQSGPGWAANIAVRRNIGPEHREKFKLDPIKV